MLQVSNDDPHLHHRGIQITFELSSVARPSRSGRVLSVRPSALDLIPRRRNQVTLEILSRTGARRIPFRIAQDAFERGDRGDGLNARRRPSRSPAHAQSSGIEADSLTSSSASNHPNDDLGVMCRITKPSRFLRSLKPREAGGLS